MNHYPMTSTVLSTWGVNIRFRWTTTCEEVTFMNQFQPNWTWNFKLPLGMTLMEEQCVNAKSEDLTNWMRLFRLINSIGGLFFTSNVA
jgi:hypothetical protein